MARSSIRVGAAALVAACALAACEAGSVVLWPWVEIADNDKPNGEAPPPPPLSPVDPLDPSNPNPTEAVPNPNANVGAPDAGTPFGEKPENSSIPISDSNPPVSAETGKPVPTLPPPTETPASPAPSPSTPE